MIRTLKSVCAKSWFERTVVGCFVGAYCVDKYQKHADLLASHLLFSFASFSYKSESELKNNMADGVTGGQECGRNLPCGLAENNGNIGLVLYYHHHSFYAQKVLMALYEKKIPFTTKLVDITKGEQYESWYLKINPKGEVPVLKDGIKFIPDSVRIIDYLEDNFSNGDHQRLLPIDQGPEVRQKIIHYRTEIDKLPANVITLGSFFNSEFCSSLKFPFVIPAVRKHLKAAENKSSESLRKSAEKNPESREVLLQKASYQDKKHIIVTEKVEFVKVLEQIGTILDEVENELSSHQGDQSDWWLCSDRFTIADISLTILLDRLSRVGLERHFWGDGQRPNIDKYYRRVQRRDAYKKAIPTPMTDIALIIKSQAPLIVGISLVTVLAVVVGGYFYFKRV